MECNESGINFELGSLRQAFQGRESARPWSAFGKVNELGPRGWLATGLGENRCLFFLNPPFVFFWKLVAKVNEEKGELEFGWAWAWCGMSHRHREEWAPRLEHFGSLRWQRKRKITAQVWAASPSLGCSVCVSPMLLSLESSSLPCCFETLEKIEAFERWAICTSRQFRGSRLLAGSAVATSVVTLLLGVQFTNSLLPVPSLFCYKIFIYLFIRV